MTCELSISDYYQDFINDVAQNLTKETVRRYHQQLGGCIEYAFRQNVISKDIAYKAHIWGTKASKKPEDK